VPCKRGPHRIDGKGKNDQDQADGRAGVLREPKLDFAADYTVPAKQERRDKGESGERVGQWVDACEEGYVIDECQPSPERGQDCGDGSTGPGGVTPDHSERQERKCHQEHLRRPDRSVVGAKDAEELFDAERQLHGVADGVQVQGRAADRRSVPCNGGLASRLGGAMAIFQAFVEYAANNTRREAAIC